MLRDDCQLEEAHEALHVAASLEGGDSAEIKDTLRAWLLAIACYWLLPSQSARSLVPAQVCMSFMCSAAAGVHFLLQFVVWHARHSAKKVAREIRGQALKSKS